MSITKIYHVVVDIYEDVYRAFGDSEEYTKRVLDAIKGSLISGQNSYYLVEEWAEFESYAEAVACNKKLMDMNYYFAHKLKK